MNCDCSQEARDLYYLKQCLSEAAPLMQRLERIENALIVMAECIKQGELDALPMLVAAVLQESEEEKDGQDGSK
jgi:hypothetical protein